MNGTVIILGKNHESSGDKIYLELLGIFSHELFHAWNACRLKPKSLQKLDYFSPIVMKEGVFLEGFTTYVSDLLMFESGIYSLEDYTHRLNSILTKHFENQANEYSSLIDSSLELWVDGYIPSHPLRKVSIYEKGCLVSLILDDWIRKATNSNQTIKDFMKHLWQSYHQNDNGYEIEDVIRELNILYNLGDLWYEKCLISKNYLLDELFSLSSFDFRLIEIENDSVWENFYGFRVQDVNNKFYIEKIDFNHPNSFLVKLNDQIIQIDGIEPALFNNFNCHAMADEIKKLVVNRNGETVHLEVKKQKSAFFKKFLFKPK
jgi:predicted metalloprotease with PDZ domain